MHGRSHFLVLFIIIAAVILFSPPPVTARSTSSSFSVALETLQKHLNSRWHIIWVNNGNTGYDEIRAAIKEAKSVTDKPTLIKVTTTIGFGSPKKVNSYSVHGAALGAKEVDATRQNLGWPYEPFHVPEDVKKVNANRN